MRSCLGLAIASILLSGVCGCGKSDAERMFPVEGTVRFGTKPLTKGTVVLHPDASRGNTSKHEPRGSIDTDGRYKITTHPQEGAPAGWYKVSVIATEPSDPTNLYSLPRWLIPEKYGQPEESGLSFEVRSEPAAKAYDLDLK